MLKKVFIGFIILLMLFGCTQSEEELSKDAVEVLQDNVVDLYPDDEDDKDEELTYPELSDLVINILPTTADAISKAEYSVTSIEDAEVVIEVEYPDLDGIVRETLSEDWLRETGDSSWDAEDVITSILAGENSKTTTETFTLKGEDSLFGVSDLEVVSGDINKLRTFGLSDGTLDFAREVIKETETVLDEEETAELSAKYNEILSTEPQVLSIDELLSLYHDNKLGYNSLHDKHIRITGYFKSSGTLYDPLGRSVPTVSLDNVSMDSWFGSQMKFTPETDVSVFASMAEGDLLTVDGIGDTEGATFSMHHCTLVDSKASGTAGASVSQINTYVPLDAEDASRNPDSWDGMLVEYTGTIQQVMKPSLFSWHTRYIVGTGANRICFYTNTSKNYMAGDTVTVRGEFSGIMQAENVFNNTSHLPDIEAHEVILH